MKKHFLLLFLMALMPFVAWGHDAGWADASTIKEIVSANLARPTFNNSYLTVTNSYNGTSCNYYSFSASYPTGNYNRYNVSIHASSDDANEGINPITTTTLAKGNYYLRVWIRGRYTNTGWNQYNNDYKVLPFQMIQKVTVTLSDFAQDWGSAEPTIATLPATAHTQDVSTWDAIDDYLTFYRENTSTDAGSYDYTLNVDATAAKAAFYEVAIAAGTPKYIINKVDASAGTVKFTPKAGLTYNGEPQALVTVENATTVVGGTLVYSVTGENGEYDAENYKQVNAGEYELWYKVKGDDNHNDTQPASIGTIAIAKEAIGYVLGNAEEIYDGHAWTPLELAIYSKISGTFYNGDNLATLGISFQFPVGKEPKNAGEYTFSKLNVVYANEDTPKNYNFIFTFTSTVNILKKDFAGVTITGTETATWDGKAQDPKWTVTDGDPSIITDADYAVVIKDEDGNVVDPKDVIEVGEYTYTFTPTENGNYEGAAIEKKFNIVGIELTESMLQGTWVEEVIYDGENHAPAAYILKDGKYVLTADDYEVVITNTEIDSKTGKAKVVTEAVNADEYTFTFTGKGHYAGSFTKTLEITRKPLVDTDFEMAETAVYNAEAQYPELTTQLNIDEDYEVSVNTGDLDKVINAGDYTYTFTGIGNYTGSVTKPFEVTPATIQISIKEDLHKDYNGTTNLGTLAPEFEYSGLQGDDKVTDITYSASTYNPAWSVENLTKNVKEDGYALTINPNRFWYKRNTAEANNYDFAVNEEITRYLFIDPIELTISFIDHDDDGNYLITKNYGQADNFNTTAWKNAHLELKGNIASEANSIRQSVVISRTNADVEAVGKYNGVLELAEMLGASVFDNYDVKEFVAGDFEILPSGDVLNVTLKNDRTKEYNGQAFTLTITKDDLAVSGYKNGDTFETTFTGGLPTVTIEGNATDAGEYAIVLSGDVAPNYTINYTNARLFITPKPITGTVATQTVHVDAPYELDQTGYTLEGVEDRDKDNMGAKLSFNPATVIEVADEYDEGIELTITNGNYELPATYGKLIVVESTNVVLSKTNDNTDVIMAVVDGPTKGKDATVTFDNFDMKANQWYAICLPFDVNPATLSKAFGYAVTDVIDETNADDMKVRFNLNMGIIKAHTPFIIKLYEAINMNQVIFEKVDITKPEGDMIVKDAANNQFIGTYTGVQFNEETNKNVYILSLSDGDFHPASATAKVRPLGAYVQGTKDWSAAGGRLVIEIEEPDGTTSINTINAEGKLVSAEGWYTVSGVKLQGAPTQKGVYIKDGKKVIIK